LEALKIDKNEKYELKESFYANFIEMQKIWKGKAKEDEEETEYHYDFLKRNCQQFVKCLFEKSTGKKLPKHIQEKIIRHDILPFGEHKMPGLEVKCQIS